MRALDGSQEMEGLDGELDLDQDGRLDFER
jgi:hypothetical protein